MLRRSLGTRRTRGMFAMLLETVEVVDGAQAAEDPYRLFVDAANASPSPLIFMSDPNWRS